MNHLRKIIVSRNRSSNGNTEFITVCTLCGDTDTLFASMNEGTSAALIYCQNCGNSLVVDLPSFKVPAQANEILRRRLDRLLE